MPCATSASSTHPCLGAKPTRTHSQEVPVTWPVIFLLPCQAPRNIAMPAFPKLHFMQLSCTQHKALPGKKKWVILSPAMTFCTKMTPVLFWEATCIPGLLPGVSSPAACAYTMQACGKSHWATHARGSHTGHSICPKKLFALGLSMLIFMPTMKQSGILSLSLALWWMHKHCLDHCSPAVLHEACTDAGGQ